jgi:hypothetical protein
MGCGGSTAVHPEAVSVGAVRRTSAENAPHPTAVQTGGASTRRPPLEPSTPVPVPPPSVTLSPQTPQQTPSVPQQAGSVNADQEQVRLGGGEGVGVGGLLGGLLLQNTHYNHIVCQSLFAPPLPVGGSLR